MTFGKQAIVGLASMLMFCIGMGIASPQGTEVSPTQASSTSATVRRASAQLFTPDLNREAEYRRTRPDQINPIQQLPVTRATYQKWLQFSGHLRYAENPAGHGQYGPRHFLPVLAEYVASGDPRYGQACVEMLKAFHRWIEEEVARKGWHALFCQEIGYIGLYREYLTRGGLLAADEEWLRALVLDFTRNLHPWDSPQTDWRGPMHRAQGEGVAKRLAAEWYPNAPEAVEWKAYSEKVYGDWWKFRDFAANDTNYLFATLQPLFLRAALLQDEQFFKDAAMSEVWQRLMQEVSPDGSVPPYGANLGWNDTAGIRVAMLEMLASKTGDGRYRFVAHRLMNYLIYQRMRYRDNHMLLGPQSTEPLALAYLFADDSIEPVEPESGSVVLVRKEAVRLPGFGGDPRDKILAEAVIGAIDAREDRGFIDCGLLVNDVPKPSKLVLRSGWKPGDFYALVDLYPRHDPLNPLGILGMTRWGASLTCTISAKARSEENRIVITKDHRGEQATAERSPPETKVIDFVDGPAVTYASVSVDGYDELPVACTRHFVFVKNEFLFVRDVISTTMPMDVTVASVFNTQNVGPRLSPNAALTYMNQPPALGVGLLNPPVDLLVYHCPLPNARLEVIDRTLNDPRTEDVRGQLRYVWSGALGEDSPRHFAVLFRPQSPTPSGQAVSSDPDLVDAASRPTLDTSFIETVLHDGLATVLRITEPQGREQWVVCNPDGRLRTIGDLQTDARAAYVEIHAGEPSVVWQNKGSTLMIRGRNLGASGGQADGGTK